MAATANPRLEAALDLARRMPPAAAPKTVDGLVSLLPRGEAALAEELLERVEQPLEEALDEGVVRAELNISPIRIKLIDQPINRHPPPHTPHTHMHDRAGPSS